MYLHFGFSDNSFALHLGVGDNQISLNLCCCNLGCIRLNGVMYLPIGIFPQNKPSQNMVQYVVIFKLKSCLREILNLSTCANSSIDAKIINSNIYVSCVMCHESHVMCHLSPVTCHLSPDHHFSV